MKLFFNALAISSLTLAATASTTSGSVAQSISGVRAPANAVGRVPMSCSRETFRGSYGVMFSGESVQKQKLNSLGIIRFYPNGRFTSEDRTRLNGASGTSNNWTGQYVINSDCSGTMVYSPVPLSGPFNTSFTVVDAGREILFQLESNEWNASGIGKRQ